MKSQIPVVIRALILSWLFLTCNPSQAGESRLPASLHLATTDWCPYACPGNETFPGIVHEYVRTILENHGILLKITYLPWTRAIREANNGKVDGLLTAVHTEAPDLLLTSTPTMQYKVCFFTRPDSLWWFRDLTSVTDIRLGGIQDYGYAPALDRYIRSPANRDSVFLIAGQQGVRRLLSMLALERIDALVDDSLVVRWTLRSPATTPTLVREAGCMTPKPFYLALNPDRAWSKQMQEWLDEAFLNTENKKLLNSLIHRYAPE